MVPPSPANPLPGLQSCLQPDTSFNLLITSGLVCLWKRSLPPGELPAGRGVPGVLGASACCYPVAVPRDWHGCTAFQESGEHRDGTQRPPLPPAGITSGVTAMAPWEEVDTGAESAAEPGKAGLLCPHTPDAANQHKENI